MCPLSITDEVGNVCLFPIADEVMDIEAVNQNGDQDLTAGQVWEQFDNSPPDSQKVLPKKRYGSGLMNRYVTNVGGQGFNAEEKWERLDEYLGTFATSLPEIAVGSVLNRFLTTFTSVFYDMFHGG